MQNIFVFTAIFWCMDHENDDPDNTDEEIDFSQLNDVRMDRSFASLTADLLREARGSGDATSG
jgi:hypothetical protein